MDAYAVHVAHMGTGLGLGGDAKNLLALAREQSHWARVSIVTTGRLDDSHRRALPVEVQLITLEGQASLPEWISTKLPDVVFVHRNGTPDEADTRLLGICAGRGIATFEYNTFARADPDTDELWTGHLHLSRASLVQYARRRGRSPTAMEDHLAAGYCVEVVEAISADQRAEARARLGLPRDALIALRLMRPDLRKWDPTPVLGVNRAVQSGVPAHLVVREAPPQRVRWARRILRSHLTLLNATLDRDELSSTFAAADVLVNYSSIGETFGLALAEGMMCSLVPVVNATPDADNAQIELCENGVTGIVANGPQALADALGFLVVRPEIRRELGAAARQSIVSKFAPPIVERRTRRFMIRRLRHRENDLWEKIPQPALDDSYILDDAWLARYEWAEGASFRKAPLRFTDLADDFKLRVLRMDDALRYASLVGPRVAVRALALRLKQGSLRRP